MLNIFQFLFKPFTPTLPYMWNHVFLVCFESTFDSSDSRLTLCCELTNHRAGSRFKIRPHIIEKLILQQMFFCLRSIIFIYPPLGRAYANNIITLTVNRYIAFKTCIYKLSISNSTPIVLLIHHNFILSPVIIAPDYFPIGMVGTIAYTVYTVYI